MSIELRIRPLQLDDIDDEYCSWYENDDGHLDYFSGSGKQFNREILLDDYATNLKSKNNFYYLIVTDNGTKIGNVRIGPIDYKNKTSDIPCLIGNRSFIGKGMGAKAIAMACDIAFKKHDIRRLHGGINAKNISAIKAHIKAGWFVEGVSQGYYLTNGVAEDRICVACLNPLYFQTKNDADNKS